MTGIVNINKPIGKTSHFAVAVIRRVTGIKKVGHTGTLDQLATGVLPICIGREATKLSDIIMQSKKQYRAVLRLGISTTTQDSEGEVTSQREVTCTEEDIHNVINDFVGDIMQVPPMYSAIKINGQKLYNLARKGVTVEREPRQITIYGIEITKVDLQSCEVELVVDCSKGTYIRTLCNDIGEALGCGGYMKSLTRTSCGGFSLDTSITLEEFERLWNEGRYEDILTSPEGYKSKL